ncbi:Arginyl-tRNA synthetase [Cladochytrium tenue]|nr:Arginyl-tRNA synthetase [Cladochytrium tenue]
MATTIKATPASAPTGTCLADLHASVLRKVARLVRRAAAAANAAADDSAPSDISYGNDKDIIQAASSEHDASVAACLRDRLRFTRAGTICVTLSPVLTPLLTATAAPSLRAADTPRSSSPPQQSPRPQASGGSQRPRAEQRRMRRMELRQQNKQRRRAAAVASDDSDLDSEGGGDDDNYGAIEGASLIGTGRTVLFDATRRVAEMWDKDDYIDSATADGCFLVLKLNPLKLLTTVVSDVQPASLPLRATVQYELPSPGQVLGANHLRGILIANYLFNCLHLSGVQVKSRCRAGIWSVETALVLYQYEISGDQSVLAADPLRHMHDLYKQATTGAQANLTRLRALARLADLYSGDASAVATCRLVLTAWARAMDGVLACYGGGDGIRLAVESDELKIAAGPRLHALLAAAREGQGFGTDAPLVDQESAVAKAMFEGDGGSETSDDEETDSDGDSDGGPVNSSVSAVAAAMVPPLVLDLRLRSADHPADADNDNGGGEISASSVNLQTRKRTEFGLARLTHIGGAPTALAVEMAGLMDAEAEAVSDAAAPTDSGRPAYRLFCVLPSARLVYHKLARRCVALYRAAGGGGGIGDRSDEATNSEALAAAVEAVTHARTLGLESLVTDGYPRATRWVEQAAAHLQHVSGKSSSSSSSAAGTGAGADGFARMSGAPSSGAAGGRSIMVYRTAEEDAAAEAEMAAAGLTVTADGVDSGGDGTKAFPPSPRHRARVWPADEEGGERGLLLPPPPPSPAVHEALAAAAITVQVLQCRRTKDCVFDWARILDARRDLGMYLQYAHARLCGIQKKAGVALDPSADLSLLARTPAANALACALAQPPTAAAAAMAPSATGGGGSGSGAGDASAFLPQVVALARSVSSGHNSMFVRGSRDDVARARMLLLWCARVAIAAGLRVVGVEPRERM